jgi:hypothetical protein
MTDKFRAGVRFSASVTLINAPLPSGLGLSGPRRLTVSHARSGSSSPSPNDGAAGPRTSRSPASSGWSAPPPPLVAISDEDLEDLEELLLEAGGANGESDASAVVRASSGGRASTSTGDSRSSFRKKLVTRRRRGGDGGESGDDGRGAPPAPRGRGPPSPGQQLISRVIGTATSTAAGAGA